MSPLINKEDHAERMGAIAGSLLDSDDFDALCEEFKNYCAKLFFSVEYGKDDSEELNKARMAHLGYQEFISFLFRLRGAADEIQLKREIDRASKEG